MPAYLLLGALRNLWHNKLHSLINIASLGLGLTVFAFAFLYVKQEASYDRGWPDAGRIHRVLAVQNGLPGRPDGEFDSLTARTFPPLTENYSAEIDKASRVYSSSVVPDPTESSTMQNLTSLAFVDATFADIFKPEVIAGSLETVLQNPGFVAVEESVAAAHPDKMTVGSRIILQGMVSFLQGKSDAKAEYQVGAIYRLPKITSSPAAFRMITLMDDYSLQLFPKGYTTWNDSVKIWLTFKPGVNIAALHGGMPDYVDRVVTYYNNNLKAGDRISNHLRYRFQPLPDLHFHPIGTEGLFPPRDQSQMLTIAAIGILVLLVGCSNSVSLSLAAVLERRRDIGIHKAVGALQNDILLQYLSEAVLLALLALLPAMALVHWLLPVFRTLMRYPATLAATPADFAMLGGIAMAVGLASGIYPALILSRVKPQQVLKSGGQGGQRGTQRTRTLLVGFQFCFAVMLMIGTLALFLQLQVLHNQPLGFNPHNLAYASANSLTLQANTAPIQDGLQKIPGVVAVTPQGNPPAGNLPLTMNSAKYLNRNNGEQIELPMQNVQFGAESMAMLEIPLLAGRMFDAARDIRDMKTGRYDNQSPDEKPLERMLLNRAAVKALGFASPAAAIEQIIYSQFSDNKGKMTERPLQIIGVVEDSFYSSLRRKPAPEIYSLIAFASTSFLLKYDDAASAIIDAEIKRVMQELTHSNQPYVDFTETRIAAEFIAEQNQSKLLLYCAGLALFLSCIGLYGLASFTMQRGIKEVGIRKAMGATVSSVTTLYLWRYAKPVLIATAIAAPISVYFVIQWLQRFPYQLELWWLLPLSLTAGGTVLVIALLTVAGIVIKTARRRPVESLRYE